MITLENVSAGYGERNVISDISLNFEKGKLYVILGENGCGKTTLFNTIAGIIDSTSGKIIIDGYDAIKMKCRKRATLVSYLMQGDKTPDMTVGELVLHGRFAYLSFPFIYSENDRRIAEQSMKTMNVDHLKDRMMSTLSGGMKQRVYLAMAIAQDSGYILLDEPTTYLDIGASDELMELLKNISRNGKGVVAVVHDIPVALSYADEIILIKDGKIFAKGKADEVFLSGNIDTVFGVNLKKACCDREYGYYISHKENT